MTLRSHRNLLDHTFYTRWVEGTLTIDELRDYAGQYAHVVRELPGWLRRASEPDHAAEEEGHVQLWLRFAKSIGMSAEDVGAAEPNAATRALLDSAQELSGGAPGVAVAWAVESQAAAVSEEKLAGLAAHYGIAGEGAEYFRVHAELDLAHTAELNSRLARLDRAQMAEAQRISDCIQDCLWDLLTSVERAA